MTWRETDSYGVFHTPTLAQETLLQIASCRSRGNIGEMQFFDKQKIAS